MEAAGAMRWTPEQFWQTTPREFGAFLEGFAASRGAKRKPKADPLSRAEFEALKAKLG